MKHRIKKIKFSYGRDANRMLMRKLAVNFLARGYLKTTISKARVLKTHLEKLVSKMKVKSEANKNYLLRYLGDKKAIDNGFKVIGPAFQKINGGYVRIVKIDMRSSDGTVMSKVEWAHPVVLESETSKVKKVAATKVTATDKK